MFLKYADSADMWVQFSVLIFRVSVLFVIYLLYLQKYQVNYFYFQKKLEKFVPRIGFKVCTLRLYLVMI